MDVRATMVASFSVPDGSRVTGDGMTIILPSGDRLELVLALQDHWGVAECTEKKYRERWDVDAVDYTDTTFEAIP